MKLIALYKTWDGGEFVDASLASVYPHCDHIVMVHSEASWLGEFGNTVQNLAEQWCCDNDTEGKVHHLEVSLQTQEQQYEAGIQYIQKNRWPFDAVLAVDADEVWEDQYFERAKQQMAERHYPAYKSNMHTYLKSPFFRVMPPFGSPTTFLRDPNQLLKSPRGCKAHAWHLDNVWMHHYTYVRETREAVERKINQSGYADGGEILVPDWMHDVYDKMPEGRDMHAFLQWRTVWHKIDKVWTDGLPAAMLAARLLPLWLPDGHLLSGEQNAIYRLAKGRHQAVDLGTYRGLSAAVLSLACERVHTVDAYEELEESYADELEPNRYHNGWECSLANTQALCTRLGNATCQQADTVAAAGEWSGGPVDVLFVDADHSYNGTMRNVEAWLPHMAKGGLVILHDNNPLHPGVMQVIDELREDSRFRFVDPGEFSGSLAVTEVM